MGRRISELYASQWLKAEDLQGRAVHVVIASATVETVKRPDGTRPELVVLSFVGKGKKLTCNATQARAIAIQLGDDIEEWPGGSIRLGPGMAGNGKETIVVLKREEER